ncbi:bidirectional sugar transporter sweet15 [Phtheirospermum japonicum]|uniref:Bidirectional sugar transporter sweet15 n=1 Tax=Phtheirospermum japonicum TaxID=374723 RepID=A0A830C8N1_9LAMI|nr:bidirectional sugar transporter sweet15 [Phtheirospermum japonicum]
MWLYYGWLNLNYAIIATNLVGSAIEVIYISAYLYYAQMPDRIVAAKLLGLFIALFVIIFSVTLPVLHGTIILSVVGWFCIFATVMAFAAPMFSVYQVFQTKSVKYNANHIVMFLNTQRRHLVHLRIAFERSPRCGNEIS